jgi:hypothetical protein
MVSPTHPIVTLGCWSRLAPNAIAGRPSSRPGGSPQFTNCTGASVGFHAAGGINTIKQAQAASGIQKVHAVIGGFHIVPPLTDEYIREVIAAFKEINPDYLIPGHCAGERFYDMVRAEMPNKVIRSAVGTRFVFGA